MIKKLFISVLFLGFFGGAWADTQIVCPSTLTCNYAAGTCDMPPGRWGIDPQYAKEPFTGSQTMPVSKISASRGLTNSQYEVECYYTYGASSSIAIYTEGNSLTGQNWVLSGFGYNQANCSTPANPGSCSWTPAS